MGATECAAEGAGVDKGNAEVPLWGRAKQVRDCVSVTVRVGKLTMRATKGVGVGGADGYAWPKVQEWARVTQARSCIKRRAKVRGGLCRLTNCCCCGIISDWKGFFVLFFN